MKRRIYLSTLLGVLFLSTFTSQSQVTIGSESLPASYSVLELQSNYDGADTYGGLRLPQMTTEQRNKLKLSPENKEHAAGLAIYNTTTACIDYWDGTEWISICKDNDLHCDGVYDAEGNFYTARRFGEAGCWMTQNLRSTKSPDNNDISFYYPGGKQTLLNQQPEYGLLYTWETAVNGTMASDTISKSGVAGTEGKVSSTVQGICPKGWVVPSDKDWSDLEKEICRYPTRYSMKTAVSGWQEQWRYTIGARPSFFNPNAHGYAMMSARNPKEEENTREGESKISPEGFDLLLAGYQEQSLYPLFGETGVLWTSTAIKEDTTEALTREMSLVQNLVGTVERQVELKQMASSVRCKKLEVRQ